MSVIAEILLDLADRYLRDSLMDPGALDHADAAVRDTLEAIEPALALTLRGQHAGFQAWLRDAAGRPKGRNTSHLFYLVVHGPIRDVREFLRDPDDQAALARILIRNRIGAPDTELRHANYVLGEAEALALTPHRIAHVRAGLDTRIATQPRAIFLPPYRDETTTQIRPMLIATPTKRRRRATSLGSWSERSLAESDQESFSIALWEFAEERGLCLHLAHGWSELALEMALQRIYAAAEVGALREARLAGSPAEFRVYPEPEGDYEVEIRLPDGLLEHVPILRAMIAHNPDGLLFRLGVLGTCSTTRLTGAA